MIADGDLNCDHFFGAASDRDLDLILITFWPSDRDLIGDRKKRDRSLLWKMNYLRLEKKEMSDIHLGPNHLLFDLQISVKT